MSARDPLDSVTVTQPTRTQDRRCRWCGAAFPVEPGPGRPQDYCRRSHRQRAYEARRQADARGLATDEAVIGAADWERLRDALYILETGIEDARRDLGEARTKADLQKALQDLIRAASEAHDARVEPRAFGGA